MTENDGKESLGAALAAMRKTFGGGRSKVMKTCRWCGKTFSARELRKHQEPCGRANKKHSYSND